MAVDTAEAGNLQQWRLKNDAKSSYQYEIETQITDRFKLGLVHPVDPVQGDMPVAGESHDVIVGREVGFPKRFESSSHTPGSASILEQRHDFVS